MVVPVEALEVAVVLVAEDRVAAIVEAVEAVASEEVRRRSSSNSSSRSSSSNRLSRTAFLNNKF